MLVNNVPEGIKNKWKTLELDEDSGLVTCISHEGYKSVSDVKKLQKGHSPRIYGKDNPFTIYNINNYLSLKNSSVTVLSTIYTDRDSKLTIWCEVCQEKSERSFNLLRKTPKCGKCANNSSSRYNNKRSIEYVEKELSTRHPNLILKSTEYVDNKTNLALFCTTCNATVYSPWKTLVSDIGCNNCAKEKSKKLFDINQSNKNKNEWVTIPAIVYIIHCTNDEESFYKVGMTTVPITKRFNCHRNMPYNFKVLKEIQTNKYEGTFIERSIQDNFKDHRYTPLIKFGGHTECFSYLDINSILEINT